VTEGGGDPDDDIVDPTRKRVGGAPPGDGSATRPLAGGVDNRWDRFLKVALRHRWNLAAAREPI
jgi:hypothetical protein